MVQRNYPGVYLFDEISTAELSLAKFSRSSEVDFSYFFLTSPFIWRCPLPISPSICKFPFLQAF